MAEGGQASDRESRAWDTSFGVTSGVLGSLPGRWEYSQLYFFKRTLNCICQRQFIFDYIIILFCIHFRWLENQTFTRGAPIFPAPTLHTEGLRPFFSETTLEVR